jgi:hypothetical protein
MTDEITWPTNKRLMASLWPKWRPTDEQARLLNDRWGLLHQDTLRKCIEDNAMQSRREPSVSAINRAYCKLTAPLVGASTSTHDTERTRRDAAYVQPLTDSEVADWEAWAEDVLATATPAEIDAVRQRMPVGESRRVLAVAVDYCRRNPERWPTPR